MGSAVCHVCLITCRQLCICVHQTASTAIHSDSLLAHCNVILDSNLVLTVQALALVLNANTLEMTACLMTVQADKEDTSILNIGIALDT